MVLVAICVWMTAVVVVVAVLAAVAVVVVVALAAVISSTRVARYQFSIASFCF